jgi:hypothetical protein
MEHDRVDHQPQLVDQVVLGAGERLFGETSQEKPLRLAGARASDDVAFLTYEAS